MKKREGEIANGKLPGIYFDRVFFDELAEDMLLDFRINDKKVDRVEQSVNHLKKSFENVRVIDITTPRIQEFIENRKQACCKDCKKRFESRSECPHCGSENIQVGAANATINRDLAALKRMLNLGARQTPPKVDRVPHIPMLKENNVRKGFFEHGEFLALRSTLPSYLGPFVTFVYKVGWRDREVSRLNWSHVDLNEGTVRLEVGETKNNEGRTVYLDDELKEVFQGQWDTFLEAQAGTILGTIADLDTKKERATSL